ncbi:MAG: SMC-Scp complex subunit ScpB [Candidatus Schekmanbacteria bacterium]|nr:SMC-Scp complex subunit ScpB [Candidatus Schekmanbacteria bacterium]
MDTQQAKSIIEALIFAAETPLTLDTLQKILHPYPYLEIKESLEELQNDYERSGRGLKLVRIAGGYQFTTQPHLVDWIKKLFKEKESRSLSAPALETLAIIAYKQPITKAEISTIRGVDVSGIVTSLLEKSLIQIVGRSENPGRPLIYGTSKDFLLHFGLDDLSGLPKMEEIMESKDGENKTAI